MVNKNIFYKKKKNKKNDSKIYTELYNNLFYNGNPKFNVTLSDNFRKLLDIRDINFNNKKNIIVADMIYCFGGAYIYLQYLIYTYSQNYNFFIVRETSDLDIFITVNDHYLISDGFNLPKAQEFLCQIDFEFIFINSLATQSINYIKLFESLPKKKIGITHDFSILYNETQPVSLSKINKIRDTDFYDLIITQNKMNKKNMNLTSDNLVISKMPDYYESHNKIDTKNNTINIAVIGSIPPIKGIYVYDELISNLKKKKIYNKYKFRIFGTVWPILKEYSFPFKDINDLNMKLIEYKPNIIIEASNWPETWSYTLTLSMTTKMPILYLKKNFNSVVADRLSKYNAHEFTDINNCIDLINKHSQNYFYTIKTDIKPILFYDSLFKGNFIKNCYYANKNIENLILITSKIVTSSNKFSYSKLRSVYTREERFNQTLNTIKSIKKYFNAEYKIMLIDDSELNSYEKEELIKKVDIILLKNDIKDISYYTNSSPIKAFGELSQQKEAVNFIKNQNIKFKNLFKISGRYLLTEKFNYNLWLGDQNVFKLAKEIIKEKPNLKDYYYTSFYKISINNFLNYYNSIFELLDKNSICLSINSYGLEQDLPKSLINKDKSCIRNIDEIGLQQIISTWDPKTYKDHYI